MTINSGVVRREPFEEQQDVLEQPALRGAVGRNKSERAFTLALKVRHEAGQVRAT